MRIDDVTFLDVDDAHAAHADAIRHGGDDGVRDLGALQSAMAAPEGGYYTSLAEMAAVYVHGIVKNHAFVDGNKRTAATILSTFLRVNNYPVELSLEWVEIIEHVADGSIVRTRLAQLIVTLLMGGTDVPIEFYD